METRASGGCCVCCVRGEKLSACCVRLFNWRGWPFMSCCACLPSSRSTPQAAPATAPSLLPQITLTLEQLEVVIPILEHEVRRLDPSTATSSSSQTPISNFLSQWEEQKQMCSSFINSIPKQLTDEVAGTSRSLFMSILTNALGGVGELHWLGVGFTFIAWSLDNITNITQNRADCIGILRRSLLLLRNTKQIWHATNIDNATRNEDLQDSVEKAFRCAIFCSSTLTDPWILRFLKASTVKDAIAMFAAELDRANIQNIEFMTRHNLQNIQFLVQRENFKMERQITYHFPDDDMVGGRDMIQAAVTYLKTGSDDIMALCLHGMGGIGKSFLGLKIFTEFQKSKYRACRVELQHEAKQENLWEIQKQILDKVGNHSTSKFSNVTDGRQNMEKELKQINDPIFLYVDNVLEPDTLHELLPKATNFPKGSRILITSRGKHIEHGIVELGITSPNFMEVKQLNEQQAQQLLWEQLESEGEHRGISEVESLEEKVLALCGGLPLAVVVVGKYIAHENGVRNVEVWREVVNAMENAEPLDGRLKDQLYSRIMFSIHNLAPNVKRAFLDIITSTTTSSSIVPWENTERLVGNTCLKVLSQRGLVRKSAGSSWWVFKYSSAEIHDVIKAMGKKMVENDEQELRITGMNKFEEHNNALKKVAALDHVTVDAYLLKQMPLLRLLKDVDVRGECQECRLRYLRVVSNLRCSTTKIFDWSECGSLKAVEWGELNNDEAAPNASNLEVFNHDKISMGLEALTLYNWSQLKDVDVIETLTCLKELRFCNCREIESLPEGISRLTGLNQLYLGGCKKLKGLPQGISRLIRLEVLDLSECESVQALPEGIGNLRAVTESS